MSYSIETVGGSLDGQLWEVGEKPRVGSEAHNLLGSPFRAAERYVFESDGRYHYYGLTPPPVHDLNEEELATLMAEEQRILAEIQPLVERLSQMYRKAGGYRFPHQVGGWVLQPDYFLFQMSMDNLAQLRKEAQKHGMEPPEFPLFP